jgi:hypothetical protein
MYDQPFILANNRIDNEKVRNKLRNYFDNKNLKVIKI